MSTAKRVYKSAQKVSGGGSVTFRGWKEWEVGDVFIGKYMSTKPDNFGNPSFMFETLDCQFKDGSGKDLVGKKFCLNSAGMLNKAMEQIAVGTIVQVAYTGMGKIEKGKYKGKDSHSMEVDIMTEGDEEAPAEDYDL